MKRLHEAGIGTMLLVVALMLAFYPAIANAAPKAKPVKGQKWPAGSLVEKVAEPKAVFDADKMSDMSDFDPATWVSPTGDTIKIAVFAPYSGPAALNGSYCWLEASWVAHDINKRGGIWVDGKKKLVELIKADTMSRADQCKKVAERMALKEKVHVFWGTPGSNMVKIMNDVAGKYKIICQNLFGLAEDLQDAENYSRYSFNTATGTSQIGRGLAYYYGQIRKKEKKFYILCQDYNFGHEMANSFKQGLKEYYPEAEIVGEDYHKLFLTDFAPYLTKIKASNAEVIYSGDWPPDISNLVKQIREFGIDIPIANVYMDDADILHSVGVEGTKGLVHFDQFSFPPPVFDYPGFKKFHKAWNDQWNNKWKTSPYSGFNSEHGNQIMTFVFQTYWLMSVIERAQSTDPEKIIKTWEGDTYRFPNGKIVMMRGCDHRSVQDFSVEEYVEPAKQKVSYNIPPYYWFKGCSAPGPAFLIPASKVFPRMDPKHDPCKGKNGWGE